MTIGKTPNTATAFDQVQFIMISPSHPGNVGAAARAIKTMGFTHLTLVDVCPSILTHSEAIARASGAVDVLKRTRIVPDLQTALVGVQLSYGLSARTRYQGPPPCNIRQAAEQSVQYIHQYGSQIALVLGTERVGLTNEQARQCNYLCHIPANEHYSSLNVAQALQLAAWELRYALLEKQNCPAALLPTGKKGIKHQRQGPAAHEQVDALLQHWFEAMLALQVTTAADNKKVAERMEQFFRRFQMQEDEVSLFRGVCTAILKHTKNTKEGQ